jgi:hypothetical protein
LQFVVPCVYSRLIYILLCLETWFFTNEFLSQQNRQTFLVTKPTHEICIHAQLREESLVLLMLIPCIYAIIRLIYSSKNIAATRLLAGQPRDLGSTSGRNLSFSHLNSTKSGCGTHPDSYQMEIGTLFLGVKSSRLAAGHSPPPSADVKCVGSPLRFPEKNSCCGSSLSRGKIVIIYLIISHLQNVFHTSEISLTLGPTRCFKYLALHSSNEDFCWSDGLTDFW